MINKTEKTRNAGKEIKIKQLRWWENKNSILFCININLISISFGYAWSFLQNNFEGQEHNLKIESRKLKQLIKEVVESQFLYGALWYRRFSKLYYMNPDTHSPMDFLFARQSSRMYCMQSVLCLGIGQLCDLISKRMPDWKSK